jgi:hypothetical protein
MEKQTNDYHLTQTNRSLKPFYPVECDPLIIDRSNQELAPLDIGYPISRKKIHLDDRYKKYKSQIMKTEPSQISQHSPTKAPRENLFRSSNIPELEGNSNNLALHLSGMNRDSLNGDSPTSKLSPIKIPLKIFPKHPMSALDIIPKKSSRLQTEITEGKKNNFSYYKQGPGNFSDSSLDGPIRDYKKTRKYGRQ